ncbi:MAG: tyrosine-type recombinase/integrase, partial [Proteobacteria bacterium]|nr:tyrosine-type recombinase/integrase [Pseudomonadota bacterium]
LASPRVDREIKNIVNLLRNTGARLSEIAGLVVSDMRLDDGDIPFITIRDNAIRGVKSDAATRRIPLLGVANEAARDALEHAKKRTKGNNPDKVPLFTCFDGSPAAAKALSNKCCNVIRGAGIKSKRLTAHSLRHTVVEALRCTEISTRLIKYIVGHSAKSVTDGYGAPWRKPEVVRDALLAALEILGDVDPSIYSEAERL